MDQENFPDVGKRTFERTDSVTSQSEQLRGSAFRSGTGDKAAQKRNHIVERIRLLAGKKLKQLSSDVEDDFEQIHEEIQEQKGNSQEQHYMHHNGRNIIPIGANFQAQIPQMLPYEYYLIRSKEMIARIHRIKIHDPKASDKFKHQYQSPIKQLISETGVEYEIGDEDFEHIYNNFQKFSPITFENYLKQTSNYWQNYFRAKEKASQSRTRTKKKKKNRGTIPT